MASTTDPDRSEADSSKTIRIAIEGCGHGTLNNIYASVAASCAAKGWPGVDLLIVCGDFQSTRNAQDLHAMAVPVKYRAMCDFHEYYSGKRVAPYLTIFVGGNHEASNYLFELYYGGWVAPRIYYMGAANVLRFGGMRIAGLSGIWKGFDYNKSHHERLPYSDDTVRSIYHVRELDARKLLQIRTQVHVGISHDWPQGIVWCGDWKKLFRRKAHLEEDARSGRLGSVAAKQVLQRLRPRYWFSAHLHVRYEAAVKHGDDQKEGFLSNGTSATDDKPNEAEHANEEPPTAARHVDIKTNEEAANSDEIQLDLTDVEEEKSMYPKDTKIDAPNPDEINLDEDDHSEHQHKPVTAQAPPEPTQAIPQELRAQLPDSFKPRQPQVTLPFPKDILNKTTEFLALDKCLPGRDFLQLLEVPPPKQNVEPASEPFQLEYDKEWLAITRVFAKDLVLGKENIRLPRNQGESSYRERIQKEEAWVTEHIMAKGFMAVPENFVITAPVYAPSTGPHSRERPIEYSNPQTSQFCSMLQIPDPVEMSDEEKARREAESARISNETPAPSQRGRRDHYQSHGGRGGYRGGRGRGRGPSLMI